MSRPCNLILVATVHTFCIKKSLLFFIRTIYKSLIRVTTTKTLNCAMSIQERYSRSTHKTILTKCQYVDLHFNTLLVRGPRLQQIVLRQPVLTRTKYTLFRVAIRMPLYETENRLSQALFSATAIVKATGLIFTQPSKATCAHVEY